MPTITFELDEKDSAVLHAEIARRQARSRFPDGGVILPDGESCIGGSLMAEAIRDLDEYRALFAKPVRHLPNAVKQTTPTNCFQACVATVLGLPIEEVPEACDGAKWDWDKFQDWLAGRGFQAIEITFENGGTIYPVRKPVPCIVTGNSPRECVTGRHAVVGELLGLEGFRLLHDPNPSEMWIDGEPTHAVFFVSI